MLEIYIFKKELVKKTVIFPQKSLEVVGSTDPDIVHWGPFFDTPLSKNLDFAPPPLNLIFMPTNLKYCLIFSQKLVKVLVNILFS